MSAATIARFLPHDKALHFIGGGLLTLAGLAGGHLIGWPAIAIGFAACAVGAVAREIYNRSSGGPFDFADIAWTVAGGGPVLGAAWVGA